MEFNSVFHKPITKDEFGNSIKSQTAAVLEHMKYYGTITSIEAIELYGATRLSGLIWYLKQLGYNIISVKRNGENRYGNHTHWAEYTLMENELWHK